MSVCSVAVKTTRRPSDRCSFPPHSQLFTRQTSSRATTSHSCTQLHTVTFVFMLHGLSVALYFTITHSHITNWPYRLHRASLWSYQTTLTWTLFNFSSWFLLKDEVLFWCLLWFFTHLFIINIFERDYKFLTADFCCSVSSMWPLSPQTFTWRTICGGNDVSVTGSLPDL